MDKDRLNLWLGFGKFFLGTVVLGLVTTFVNNKIQEREIELKELDQLGQFMVHALDEDVGKRRRFAQYFARVTRSSELRSGWERYEQLVQKEFDDTKSEFEKTRVALAEAQKRGEPQTFEVLRLQSDLDRLRAAIEVAPSASARVFVHIRSEEQRALAKQVIEALQRQGVLVPGVEKVVSGPARSELRYFNAADKTNGETLHGLMKQAGVDASVVYTPGFKVPAKQFELWLAPAQ